MRTSAAKAKGRRLTLQVREMLLGWAPDLQPDDIKVASSGSNGEDVLLSPAARKIYGYSIECKNQEKTSPWEWFEQASMNAKNWVPLVVFCRNRSEPMVLLRFEDFLKLTR